MLDLAEAAWVEADTAQDTCMLLAAVAAGLGAKKLRGYRPPAQRIADELYGRQEEQVTTGTPARAMQIARAAAAAGGEAG